MSVDTLPLLTTPFWDTTWLRFLHIVAATAVLGSALAIMLLAIRSGSIAPEERGVYARVTHDLATNLVTPALFFTAVLGVITAFRFSERGLFDVWQQHWMFGGIITWFLAMGVTGAIAANARRSGQVAIGGPDLLRPALLIVLVIATLALMIFQPG